MPGRRGVLFRLRHPQTTVRWRLTLLYGSLFVLCGAALLAVTYTLVAHAAIRGVISAPFGSLPHAQGARSRWPSGSSGLLDANGLLYTSAGKALVKLAYSEQRISDLHQLEVWSGIALAITAVISGGLGWVAAGRVLRPLRTITATTEDISEHNLHQRLAMAGPRDELRGLADTIDKLLARLEGAFESQRRFVANASHELRTPLAMMRTTLDVALTSPEGVPVQVKALDAELRQDLDHADQLLESFLVLARAEHREVGEKRAVAVDRIVAVGLAARADQIAALELTVETALAPVRVLGSETLLARMVENVIDNAVRHNQPHGVIQVACEIDGANARLLVETDGPLLDERRVAELAQPFRRLGQERTYSQNGHGLGLSIVGAVAAAHGGTLVLRARPQGGLRVEITLPGTNAAEPAGPRA